MSQQPSHLPYSMSSTSLISSLSTLPSPQKRSLTHLLALSSRPFPAASIPDLEASHLTSAVKTATKTALLYNTYNSLPVPEGAPSATMYLTPTLFGYYSFLLKKQLPQSFFANLCTLDKPNEHVHLALALLLLSTSKSLPTVTPLSSPSRSSVYLDFALTNHRCTNSTVADDVVETLLRHLTALHVTPNVFYDTAAHVPTLTRSVSAVSGEIDPWALVNQALREEESKEERTEEKVEERTDVPASVVVEYIKSYGVEFGEGGGYEREETIRRFFTHHEG